jgi:uncharacterized integral membrane protein (TIGR00698 family)
MNAWERNLLGVRVAEVPTLAPGLLAAGLLAWASTELCEYLGVSVLGFSKSPVSPVMLVLILGILVGNTISLPRWLAPGIRFAVKKVLRAGIILLGIRLGIGDVFRLGALGVPIVLLCIASALYLTIRASKWLELPERLGTLIAVGTSICGVSAIVATAPTIEAEDEEVAYATGVITLFGILAMMIYPFLAHRIFAGDPVRSGLFLGTAIHETAQVSGAAVQFSETFSSPRGLEVATVAKLVRNVFMAGVIPLMALYRARRSETTKGKNKWAAFRRTFPVFILGFLGFTLLRSIGDLGLESGGMALGIWDSGTWSSICNSLRGWAVNLMVVALAGVGLSTDLGALRELGVKPMVVGMGAALLVGLVSLGMIKLLGAWLTF